MRGLSRGRERFLVYLIFGSVLFWLGCRAPADDLRIDYLAAQRVAQGQWSQVYTRKLVSDPVRTGRTFAPQFGVAVPSL